MKNILDSLEETASRYAWETAVDDGNIYMTWSELLELSKCIGTKLCKRVERQKPIVILEEKSAVVLATMFGVVYAGCFYVIVDPSQPAGRIKDIFQTVSPELVITSKENEKILCSLTVLYL